MKKHTILLALSMAIFGTIAPFVRMTGLASSEVALYRAVLAIAFIGLFLLITGQKIDFKTIKKPLPLLVISGIAMGFNWILLFQAYKYTTVSVATLSYYFAPVIVTVACPLLFKERLGHKGWLCFVMSTVGLVLITGVGDIENPLGIVFGLGAAVLYAAVVLLNKYIKGVDGIQRTFLQFVSAAVVLLPYVAFTDGFNFTALDGKGWIALLTVGLVHTGICYCLYFSSLGSLSGQKVSILSYIDPLIAVLISVAVLGESMNLWQWIGGAMILGFTLLNEIKTK
ncbi:MAG: EamA family transporter [Clostridia bacterium]|nr:EamA family transporter [Clostridia bacterium]